MGVLPDYLFNPNTLAGRGDLMGGDSYADRWPPAQPLPPAGPVPAGPAFNTSAWAWPNPAAMPLFGASPPAAATPPAPPALQQTGNAAVAAPSGGTMPSALNSLPIVSMPSLFPQGSPGIGDRLDAGLMGFANSNAPLPAIANLIHGLATGERSDQQGVAQRQQDQAQGAAYQALRSAGVPEQQARAGALDPNTLRTGIAGQPQPQPQRSQTPPAPGARMAPDGSWYVPDQTRPGRYLKMP
jgi:hypothetical protein